MALGQRPIEVDDGVVCDATLQTSGSNGAGTMRSRPVQVNRGGNAGTRTVPHAGQVLFIRRIHRKSHAANFSEKQAMPMQSRISKWGNSLGVRVPREVAVRAGLSEGARIDIEGYADGRIVITQSRRRFTLDELLAGMTPEREHPLEDDGPRGEEAL